MIPTEEFSPSDQAYALAAAQAMAGAGAVYKPAKSGPAIVWGEMPNAAGAVAYETRSGRRMQQLTGRYLEWQNIFTVNRKWSTMAARRRVVAWTQHPERVDGSQVLLLLGNRVARAFDLPSDVEWLEWYRSPTHAHPMIAVPHPSGRNRWWNDMDNVAEARRLLREVARGNLPHYDYKGGEV